MIDNLKIPTGYEFSHVDGDEIVLKQIRPRVRKWEEQGTLNGFFVDSFSRVIEHQYMDRLSTNQNAFHTEEQAKAAIALAKLTISLADLQQPPIVWDGVKEYYCIWANLNYDKIRILKGTLCSSPQLLAFHDEQTCDEFLKIHREDIEAAASVLWGVKIEGGDE